MSDIFYTETTTNLLVSFQAALLTVILPAASPYQGEDGNHL